MLYPEIPKGKIRGTYIAGAIFSIIAGAIILLLFIPEFFLSFGVVTWDWNTLGIGMNLNFLNAMLSYLCYVAGFVCLFVINVIFMFI